MESSSWCIAVALRCWVGTADHAFGRIGTLIVASGLSLAMSLGLPNGVFDILCSLPMRYAKMLVKRGLDLRRPAPALVLSMMLGGLAVGLTIKELMPLLRAA